MKKIALLMFMSTLFTVMPANADVASFKEALATARDHAVADSQNVTAEAEKLTEEEAEAFKNSVEVPELLEYFSDTLSTHSDVATMYDIFVGTSGGEYLLAPSKDLVNQYKDYLKQQEQEAKDEEEAELELMKRAEEQLQK